MVAYWPRKACSWQPGEWLLFFLVHASISGFAQSNESDGGFTFKKYAKVQLGGIYSKVSYNNTQESIKGIFLSHNYLIKPKVNYCIGIGSKILVYKKQIFVPIYLDFVTCTKSNLYFDFQPGYSLGWERKAEHYENYDLKGGLYGKFGVGYKVRINDEFSSCIQISYSYQDAHLESSTLSPELMSFHSIMISLGLLLDRK